MIVSPDDLWAWSGGVWGVFASGDIVNLNPKAALLGSGYGTGDQGLAVFMGKVWLEHNGAQASCDYKGFSLVHTGFVSAVRQGVCPWAAGTAYWWRPPGHVGLVHQRAKGWMCSVAY